MKKALALKAGDTIGIAAPSSPFDRATFNKGAAVLKHMGFKVLYREDIFDQDRYLAGTDERRAEEFTELMRRRDISAVMFARGGYGSQRVIPLLDMKAIGEHPKPVIGFSDLTALLTYLRQSAGTPTFYGPVLTQLGKARTGPTIEALQRALTTAGPMGEVPVGSAKTFKEGRATGELVGGCLSLIASSIGTQYELNMNGKVLFIEEINEKVYVLDRMLTQLKNGGRLSSVTGIIFGSIVSPEDEGHDTEAMIRDVLSDFGGPIIMNFPAGHASDFITLPMGATVEFAAYAGKPPAIKFSSGLLA